MKRDRILITGHTGKIGKHLWKRLEGEYKLRGYDKANNRRDDLKNRNRLTRAMRGCRAIVHSAAIPHPTLGSHQDVFKTNVEGTFNVFDCALQAQIRRVIMLSSITYYGIFTDPDWKPAYLPVDEDHPPYSIRPGFRGEKLDIYGQSKVMAEQLAAWFGTNTNLECIALRFATVGDEESLFHRHVRNGGGRIPNFKKILWSHIDPDSVVVAIKSSLEYPRQVEFEAMNIANKRLSSAFSIEQIVEEHFKGIPLRIESGNMLGLFSVAKAERMLGVEL